MFEQNPQQVSSSTMLGQEADRGAKMGEKNYVYPIRLFDGDKYILTKICKPLVFVKM